MNSFEEQEEEAIKQPSYDMNLYPLCIVWTILPCISWFVPWIGHTGICTTKGTIYDFLGYHVNFKNMAFGNPRKYVFLKDIIDLKAYDRAVKQANDQFSEQAHDLCCNNCHHHVGRVLNLVKYRGRENWTQVSIWWMCIWEGNYVKWWAPFLIYFPFLVISAIIVAVIMVSGNQE